MSEKNNYGTCDCSPNHWQESALAAALPVAPATLSVDASFRWEPSKLPFSRFDSNAPSCFSIKPSSSLRCGVEWRLDCFGPIGPDVAIKYLF